MSDHAEPVVEEPVAARYLIKRLCESARNLILRGKRTQKMWFQFFRALQGFHDNNLGRVLFDYECPPCLEFFLQAIQPGTLIYFDTDSAAIAFVRDDARKTSIPWPNGKQWAWTPNIKTADHFLRAIDLLAAISGFEIEEHLGFSATNTDLIILKVSDKPTK